MENGSSEDCCVKVAVHIRPLIADERLHSCKDCVIVVPGKPQVQLGSHSFTFDYVYGSTGSPSSAMFEECVAPLVDGLFQGYNATVLAYGQTGSGKTYTMGTGFREGYQSGIIPQVMNILFDKLKIGGIKLNSRYILKEEVRDLLDQSSVGKADAFNIPAGKTIPGKPPVQIRETSNGVITLAGSTEVDVRTQNEMASCLEQGSLNRATGSTNMNNQSSRSHAIFTITLEQIRKLAPVFNADGETIDEMNEDYLCAKLHLVDLAGSERAKRTGSDGLRFKEGLLALGNVISALGDEKKRKEGIHVPYRDSKLTRLLQDSLGGNSRTVMIACISPADINEEETLNTLKYANRARNIQNKPMVNRDPLSSEMQRMRQQLEYLQAELICARGMGSSPDEIQALKEKILCLEVTNEHLSTELQLYRRRCALLEKSGRATLEDGTCVEKAEGTKRSLRNIDSFDHHVDAITKGNSEKEIPEVVEKEREHTLLQDTMGKELNELNRLLEQKEQEIKSFEGVSTFALKQHFGKKLLELEEEKKILQKERDRLSAEVENLATMSGAQAQRDIHSQKLKYLEAQILDLKRKQESQVQLLKQKQKSDDAARKLQEEILSIKVQKVQLQQKIKHEAEQFRLWKVSQEKELMQLRKEGRRNEYERHKLLALNQRQQLVLQRKTEEAAIATRRLKELLETRKTSREIAGIPNGHSHGSQANENSLQQWVDHDLEVVVNVHEVRNEYVKQKLVQVGLAEELALLKEGMEMISKGLSPPRGKNGYSRVSSMSPDPRLSRIASLENMMTISSNTLLAMSSQLSEAEERERAFAGRGRWSQLRSMADAKNLLQYLFKIATEARCHLKEKETEIEEYKEQLKELVSLLQLSEARRKEILKQQKLREQTVSVALGTPGNSQNAHKHGVDDTSAPISPVALPANKQLKYTPGIVNGPCREAIGSTNTLQKMQPGGQLSLGKKVAMVGRAGKLWRWRRSHHRWLLEFKWKWQKPWRFSELIRHSDQMITRARPHPSRCLPQMS
ncbi:unnamed protein product [Spirodela intermedia]|uniref:Kinesin motor domain-containing protein n=1 Tax=Spirodela intermedia TaxID=51605 RepID=A0A7I8ITY3_SPIIN|nr:unnamed protein product [Spirodela intermedia]CAA6661425.1 unnamed protein product [Spirodela intermedia]